MKINQFYLYLLPNSRKVCYFGHLSVKRATLFWAFLNLLINTIFGNDLDFLPSVTSE